MGDHDGEGGNDLATILGICVGVVFFIWWVLSKSLYIVRQSEGIGP